MFLNSSLSTFDMLCDREEIKYLPSRQIPAFEHNDVKGKLWKSAKLGRVSKSMHGLSRL